ncbi:MAG: M15 family metallopeptidase [Clostridium fessum]
MRDITLCHPRLQKLITQLTSECANAGLPIKIGESFRSVAEQDALYAQGRTQPGSIVTNARGSSYSSQHQWGIAADFYRADGKGAYNESGDYFKKVGELAKNLGLAWGGDWKSIVDKPHVYLPDWGSGTGILKQKYGTFEAFKKTWAAENSTVPEQSKTVILDLKEIKSGIRELRVTASSLIIRTTPKGTRHRQGATPRISVCSQLINALPTAIRGSRLRTAGCLASILLAGCARTGVGGIC